jgi:CubicO group peptidase (beta-lactamase class C family)
MSVACFFSGARERQEKARAQGVTDVFLKHRNVRFGGGPGGLLSKDLTASDGRVRYAPAVNGEKLIPRLRCIEFCPEASLPGEFSMSRRTAQSRYGDFRILRLVLGAALLVSARPLLSRAATFDDITKRMEAFVADHQISGAVTLVAHEGRVVHISATGRADVEGEVAMAPNSVFVIASMTKPMTATAVLMLQDEGKLSIDDAVEKHIPSFAKAKLKSGESVRGLTIKHLLTHTSGLGGSQDVQGSIAQSAEELAQRPFDFQPGEKWQYGPSLAVCGRIIEVVSGKSYEDFLAERIFRPLGMTDTTFHPNDEQKARLARLYRPGESQGTLSRAEHWLASTAPDRVPNPSGGLFSTAEDVFRFYQMIANGGEWEGRRIVSTDAVKSLTSIQTGELVTGFTPGNGWGLGFCIVRKPEGVTGMLSPGSFGHGGAFGTQVWVDPARQNVFVLMIQRTDFGNSDASDVRGEFQRIASEALTTK